MLHIRQRALFIKTNKAKKKYHLSPIITIEWFQPNMSTFLRALSFYGIQKQARKYLSQNLFVFRNKIAKYTIYS